MAQTNVAKDKKYGQLGKKIKYSQGQEIWTHGPKIQPRTRNMDTWPKQM
jgi:hypothetical protein